MINKKGKRWSYSGVPLGGIGAGKIEVCPNGKISNCFTNNNWDAPICDGTAKSKPQYNPDGIPGAFWGLFVSGIGAKVLKTHSNPNFHSCKESEIRYNGMFPFVELSYNQYGGIKCELSAFSPLILNDESENYKNSSLPAAVFTFSIANKTRTARESAVCFSWQNLIGVGGYAGNVINDTNGNYCKFEKQGNYSCILFDNKNDTLELRVKGNYSLLTESLSDRQISYWAGWDYNEDAPAFWRDFSKKGKFQNLEGNGNCGTISVKFNLSGKETKKVTFILSWFFPHLVGAEDSLDRPDVKPKVKSYYGHAYENWFSSSSEVAKYVYENLNALLTATKKWHDLLKNSNLPKWFIEKSVNDLFPLYSNTWYTKDFRFTVNESPTDMNGCLGTIDQRASSNSIYTMAFPKLSKSELTLFASQQIKEDDPYRYDLHWNLKTGKYDLKLDRLGAIRHDVGWDDLEGGYLGKKEWTTLHWPDLTSVFVLQCYEYYIWTNDNEFLEYVYPRIKRALEFQHRLDQNNDGVPDLWGPGCCTYDNKWFPYYGASSFIISLYVAALRAGNKLAEMKDDKDFFNITLQRIKKATYIMESRLWKDELKYYISWFDEAYKNWEGKERLHNISSLNCTIAQLAGQWFANLFNLSYLFKPDRIKKSLKTMFNLNVRTVYCPANESNQAKERSFSWPYYTETYYASLAIQEGFVEEGWKAIKKIYKAMYRVDSSPWNAPLVWKGPFNTNVEWGNWYMTNPASWFVLLAIGGFYLNLPLKEIGILPSQELKDFPVFMPLFWGEINYKKEKGGINLSFKLTRKFFKENLDFNKFYIKFPKEVTAPVVKYLSLSLNGEEIKFKKYEIEITAKKLIIYSDFKLENIGDIINIKCSVG